MVALELLKINVVIHVPLILLEAAAHSAYQYATNLHKGHSPPALAPRRASLNLLRL